MTKRSFKIGGNSRTVETVGEAVTESDTDAGATPAIDSDVADSDVGEAVHVPKGWDVIDGGTDQEANTVASLDDAGSPPGCEPDVINVLQALRADDDGMGEMRPVLHVSPEIADAFGMGDLVTAGLVVADDGVDAEADTLEEAEALDAEFEGESALISDVTDALVEVVTSEPAAPSVFAALVAAHRPIVADCVVRVDLPAMLAVDARAMAQRIADMTGHSVSVCGPNGTEAVAPKRGGGGVRVPSIVKLANASRSSDADKPVRLTPGLSVAGDWLTYDARVVCTHPGNASNVKVWDKIRDAAERLDLDTLLAFDFAGARDESSGNTYTKANGRFLRAHIANVPKVKAEREAARVAAEAALDAEFGFRLAAD